MRLILASTSPYRRNQLESLGVVFEAAAPAVDEESLKRSFAGAPAELALRLAIAKAQSLAGDDRVVIGGDQIAVLDGRILEKPGAAARGMEQLQSLSGRTHELFTALAVVSLGSVATHLDVSRLTMRRLSLEEIRDYVELDEPFDCCGAYKFESAGRRLFEKVDSEDPSAITGLPLAALTRMLRERGWNVAPRAQ